MYIVSHFFVLLYAMLSYGSLDMYILFLLSVNDADVFYFL
jgi:hypothetical protein